MQETWLLKDSLCRMNDLNQNYLSAGKSAVSSDKMLHGRPYGGVGLIWHKSLALQVVPIPVPSNRIAALIVTHSDGSKTLVINIYMPCDNRSMSSVAHEYEKCIETLDELLISVAYNDVIIGGDMNTDNARNNAHAKCLSDFCARNSLKNLWNEKLCNDKFTYISSDLNAKSCIDHFLISRTVPVLGFNVIEEVINPSNHLPIQCIIKCDTMRIKSDHAQKTQTHNIAWHRISDKMSSQFQDKVNKSVQRVPQHLYLCLNCKDTNCQSHGHKQALDKLCDHMENMLVNNAMQCFPKTKKRHALPYWNEKVQPLKNESIFWHWMWRECGQPATGVVTDTYKRCKRKYHAAIKDLKRQQNELRNARMAESIARNNSRDLWKELNKMKPRCKVIPPQVDGNADNKLVCKLFAQKYETLLNSVPADGGKMAQIKSKLADRVSRKRIFFHSDC